MNSRAPFSHHDLKRLIAGRKGVQNVPCPLCGPDRRTAANRTRHVLRIWNVSPGFISYNCARCREKGWAKEESARAVNPSTLACIQSDIAEREKVETAARLAKAGALWRRRLPIIGSPAERYLRDARRYGGPLPARLGFLPGRGDYPPAMIAAYALPDELEPGILGAPLDVRAVHLTRLRPDGSDRERCEKAKITISSPRAHPIVLAPPNDLLGLAITEGIEDGLTVHQATGLGVWVAGSASFMPALADTVPTYIESLTIYAHNDGGKDFALQLANSLAARGIEIRIEGLRR